MPVIQETVGRLGQIPNLQVTRDTPLARYTRFGIGGPADIYAETASVDTFVAALNAARASGLAWVVIGGGTNLVVSDAGFRGIVLRFTAEAVRADGRSVIADAGAELQKVVDCSVAAGLRGLETLAGIPGSLGAAVYGNAGAYGHSISEVVSTVRFFDGDTVRVASNAACEFHYRESVFKRHKDWIVFSADLSLAPGDAAELERTAADIVATRNRKFPPTMKCAGSVFKNLILAELPAPVAAQVPAGVVREGKVPAAYFLEQAGAKGQVCGDIHVADYHANLIYNAGAGTARQLRELIAALKQRVRARFGFDLEEEVQYVGF
ncbi:MAG TPA: UDP-N-acetylmuramate dehydrogenase [Bryobacteraceae bacterium]|nr:UDP-N-acetylmuramate dehydrogenase [Bryobacteraceae bacterium]